MARRILTVLTLTVAGVLSAPDSAQAEPDCTTEYELCLNSAVQKGPIFEELASIECAVEWFACVKDAL